MKPERRASKEKDGNSIFNRERLNVLFETGLSKPAVFVSAEAGFGKTKAVSGFLGQTDYKRVWQQLTVLDNLPIRFWESFVKVVSAHRPKLGAKLLSFGFPYSLSDFHFFLKLFTKELYTDDQFVIFVFDDYHYIDNINIKTFFQRFVAADLENICLFFLTRRKEIFPYEEKVFQITTEELRFTKEETRGYFEHRGIAVVKQQAIDEIYTYTKGWGVALYLMSLQLEKKGRAEASGKMDPKRIIFQLMEKEIFSIYSKKEQHFLILLSALSFFPKEMLRRLSANLEVDAIAIVENNAFIVYDSEADSYYCHQLFWDFLLEKGKGEQPSSLFLENAGDWCLENGFFMDAMHYYEKGGQGAKMIKVLRNLLGARQSKEDAEFFMKYIDALSGNLVNQSLIYELNYGMFLLNNLRASEAMERLKQVRELVKGNDKTVENRELLGEVLIGEGLIYMSQGNISFVSKFKMAQEILSKGSKNWVSSLHIVEFSSALYVSRARTGEANRWIEALFEGIPYMSEVLQGVGYGMEYLARAEYSFLTGDFKRAQKDAYEAFYRSGEKGQQDIADNALFLLLRICLATGKIPALEEILQQLRERDPQYYRHKKSVPDIALGWYDSELGQISSVVPWIFEEETIEKPPISVDRDALLYMRCLIEKEEYYKALAVSKQIEETFNKRNKITSKIYILVYKTIILYHLKETEEAGQVLVQAYKLAAPDDMLMPFIEFGHKTRALLAHFCSTKLDGVPQEVLENLHKKASTYAKNRARLVSEVRKRDSVGNNDYGLSSREKELLQYLSQGSNRDEMAACMYVSPHTIKSMLKTVYNKMGAINAADAVRLAGIAKLI